MTMKKINNILCILMTIFMVGLVSCEGEFELIKFPDLTDRVEQGTVNNPYSVADVIAINPTSTTVTTTPNVWVQGYIVGYRDSDVTPDRKSVV